MNIVTLSCVLPLGKEPAVWDRGIRVKHGNLFDADYDLTILLRNLAVAGALCAAFYTGAEAEWRRMWRGDASATLDWHPGCGREVPR